MATVLTCPSTEIATLQTADVALQTLLVSLEPLQQRLAAHPLYRSIRSLRSLQLFMESHVFAVWDFMSLLKDLQRRLTCVEVPWRPTADAASRRLINEIVLGEESDTYAGEAISHFELYLQAMKSCGASTMQVNSLVAKLQQRPKNNESEEDLLQGALAGAPAEAVDFVNSTFELLATGETHRIAAAFTFGREDLIPDMFSAFVRELQEQLPGKIEPFRYYLERHIEMDGDEHGPMALAMMRQLCQTPQQWDDATQTAKAALLARLAFWDGIHARIVASEGS
jgi:hypothetical protein